MRNGFTAGRGALVAATAVAAAVGVAGCGAGGADEDVKPRATAAKKVPTPRAAVAAARGKVSAAGSVTFTATAETGIPGRTDDADHSARLSGTVGPGAADFSFRASDFAAMGPAFPSTVAVRESGTSMYLDLGPRFAAATGGRPWVVMRASDFVTDGSDPLEVLLGQALWPVGEGPGEQLDLLAAAGQVRDLGVERADGVAAGHYQGDVTPDDMKKAAAGTAGAEAARISALAGQLDDSGVHTETVDVWVAKTGPRAGRPVRVDLTLVSGGNVTTDSVHYTSYDRARLRNVVPPRARTATERDLEAIGDGAH
ncbi:hypothetical protein [Streptomyces fuscigenes]|uniref:hypothetical protein n=1 Tax=Streptomyces fuscigenes TaxID=1528880 RepID=UPI001F1B228C|nr:hypothetical protein [Streptomyces fuscigenes]MCF3962374.1 hypothetical protein [Streptomyces fuscigenes]